MRKIKLLYCFDPESLQDAPLKKELSKHLTPLRRTGAIEDVTLAPGLDAAAIRREAEDAELALVLVSADLAAIEDPRLLDEVLQRYLAGRIRLVPVLLRGHDWRKEPYGGLTPLPQNGKPVTLWSDRDSAWVEVVRGITAVVEELAKRPGLDPLPPPPDPGAPPPPPRRAELEAQIREENPYLDPAVLRFRLERAEWAVCRVDLQNRPCGTGFLVAPNLVLTNHHVLRQVFSGAIPEGDVSFRFDHKRDPRAVAPPPGPTFPLAEILDQSPPQPEEAEPGEPATLPGQDQLDFVLVRLQGQPGLARVGARTRGWLSLKEPVGTPPAGAPLWILGHPALAGDAGAARPLKLSMDRVIGLNQNGTRLRYTTNTEGGSSGSPCLDDSLRLVALHHRGVAGMYNQGVPIGKIRARLQAGGFLAKLGGEPPLEALQADQTEGATWDDASARQFLLDASRRFLDESLLNTFLFLENINKGSLEGSSLHGRIVSLLERLTNEQRTDSLIRFLDRERPHWRGAGGR